MSSIVQVARDAALIHVRIEFRNVRPAVNEYERGFGIGWEHGSVDGARLIASRLPTRDELIDLLDVNMEIAETSEYGEIMVTSDLYALADAVMSLIERKVRGE